MTSEILIKYYEELRKNPSDISSAQLNVKPIQSDIHEIYFV